MTSQVDGSSDWIICDNCKGFGGFEATRFSNGGLCPKCKGHGGWYKNAL